jgi:hypothetical protein
VENYRKISGMNVEESGEESTEEVEQ